MRGRISRSSAIEACAVLAVAVLLALQLLSYPVTDDPDPDGYVTYAEHLKAAWSLPPNHHRLPGYPLFVAVVDSVGPSTMHVDVYWAQFGLYLLWVGVLWLGVRRLLGPLPALVFLALLAIPAFLTRYAVVMVADLLASVLVSAAAAVLLLFVLATRRGPLLGWLVALVALAVVSCVVHPLTRLIVPLLAGCLGVAAVLCRGRVGQVRLPIGRVLLRVVVAAVLCLLAPTVTARLFDRGTDRYATVSFAAYVLGCLPPATDTEYDRQIEAGKAAAAARIGSLIRDASPRYYPELAPVYDVPPQTLQSMVQDRLLTYPVAFVGCSLNQTRLRWHIVLKQYMPFWDPIPLAALTYLPETGSPRSTLYRTVGVELPYVPDSASWRELMGPLAFELGRTLLFVVVLSVGSMVLVRRFGAPALAVVLAVLIWGAVLGLVHVFDARYLAPLAPGIHLAQAVGIVATVRASWSVLRRRGGRRAGSRMAGQPPLTGAAEQPSLDGAAERWAGDAASVWTGMAAWRTAHPQATFSEIEAALDERLRPVRARVLADLAPTSAAGEGLSLLDDDLGLPRAR